MVLTHGFGGSSYTYRKVLGRLANSPPAGYRVIALDLYGFGLGARPGQILGRDTWGLPSTAKRSGQCAASPA